MTGSPRRGRVARLAVAVVCALTVAVVTPSRVGATLDEADLEVVFSAVQRSTGLQGIWRTAVDEPGVVPLTLPKRGTRYLWPSWAFDGHAIVFTVGDVAAGGDGIYLMDADGSDPRPLLGNTWRHGQPHVSPDHQRLVFSSFWEEFPKLGIFEMDLSTGLVTNRSRVRSPSGGLDSDPRYAPGGRIVFASSFRGPGEGNVPTDIWIMQEDGTGAEPLSSGDAFDTDPMVSPDGRYIAYASYRGEGGAAAEVDEVGEPRVKLQDWYLVVRDLETGEERVLNQGQRCSRRAPETPCGPLDGPAYVPVWSPDSSTIGYIGVLSSTSVCICAVEVDGSDPRVILTDPDLAIDWFDWVQPGQARPSAQLEAIRSEVPTTRLLVGGETEAGDAGLLQTGTDRWGGAALPLPDGLEPTSARWSPDRRFVVFSAATDYDPADAAPTPPPPAGAERREHVTLSEIEPTYVELEPDPDIGRHQTFVLEVATGALEQITTPWTEDYRDGVREGDARGNINPSFTPDGSAVVVSNVSALTGEAFLLRIDLGTGEVVNLTNATSGALPVADLMPDVSPSDGRVAFISSVAGVTDVWVMDADGNGAGPITDDDDVELDPAWSPDGQLLAYVSHPGDEPTVPAAVGAEPPSELGLPASDWQLNVVDTSSGRIRTVVSGSAALSGPVWSPAGDRIAYVRWDQAAGELPDLYVVDAAGGTPPEPIQVTLETHETFLDWR